MSLTHGALIIPYHTLLNGKPEALSSLQIKQNINVTAILQSLIFLTKTYFSTLLISMLKEKNI